MHRSLEYLRRAEEAEAKAAKGSGEFRAQMLAIAEQWREMARQASDLAEDAETRTPKD